MFYLKIKRLELVCFWYNKFEKEVVCFYKYKVQKYVFLVRRLSCIDEHSFSKSGSMLVNFKRNLRPRMFLHFDLSLFFFILRKNLQYFCLPFRYYFKFYNNVTKLYLFFLFFSFELVCFLFFLFSHGTLKMASRKPWVPRNPGWETLF